MLSIVWIPIKSLNHKAYHLQVFFYQTSEHIDGDNDETTTPLTINTNLDMIHNSLVVLNYHTNNDEYTYIQ